MIWALATAAGFGFLAGLAVGGVLARHHRPRRLPEPLSPWPPPLIRSALQEHMRDEIIWQPARPTTWGSYKKASDR